ncbi:hypothetical protein FE781_08600 [Paenibacillus thermoaerophilus]|nr:hypothetical protein FE781_08600 [Paenibacillus thermoaerophilus]
MREMLHDLVQNALLWIESLGYWGIMIGLMIEIIPSEIVLGYGGYLVYQGKVSFWGAVLFGTVGGVIAQLFVYWIGRYGGRPFLEKYGKYILINKHHLDVAENWFNKYGTGVIFTARFIPVVRHAISVPAGIARMPLSRFTLLTTLAVIPWSIFFVWLGQSLGKNWGNIEEEGSKYIGWFMAGAVLLLGAYIGYKMWRSRKEKERKASVSGVGAGADAAEAERTVEALLQSMEGDYRVLRGRRLRTGSGALEIDCIVVGPNGVFHIDAKDWPGAIRFSAQGVQKEAGPGGEDPTARLYRQEYALKELLREHGLQADIVGILCLTHPEAKVEGSSPAFYTVKPEGLVRAIRDHRAQKPLDADAANRLAKLIEDQSAGA